MINIFIELACFAETIFIVVNKAEQNKHITMVCLI